MFAHPKMPLLLLLGTSNFDLGPAFRYGRPTHQLAMPEFRDPDKLLRRKGRTGWRIHLPYYVGSASALTSRVSPVIQDHKPTPSYGNDFIYSRFSYSALFVVSIRRFIPNGEGNSHRRQRSSIRIKLFANGGMSISY